MVNVIRHWSSTSDWCGWIKDFRLGGINCMYVLCSLSVASFPLLFFPPTPSFSHIPSSLSMHHRLSGISTYGPVEALWHALPYLSIVCYGPRLLCNFDDLPLCPSCFPLLLYTSMGPSSSQLGGWWSAVWLEPGRVANHCTLITLLTHTIFPLIEDRV